MALFHISEVVDLGIEKEKQRRDFYAAAAKEFPDDRLQQLFLQLRDWEEAHIQKFTEIRDALGGEGTTESFTGEFIEYMKALVSDKLYYDVSGGAFAKNVLGPIDAIYYGIEFEKDAIVFFSELRGMASGPYAEAIQRLIDEEKKHIVYLAQMRQKLSAEGKAR